LVDVESDGCEVVRAAFVLERFFAEEFQLLHADVERFDISSRDFRVTGCLSITRVVTDSIEIGVHGVVHVSYLVVVVKERFSSNI
jgi:hypothetical protein